MKRRLALPLIFALLLTSTLALGGRRQDLRVIDAGFHHLGNDPTPEWPEAALDPEGDRLELTFVARDFEGEGVLLLTLRDNNNPWHVEINGVRIATLASVGGEPADVHYTLPAGVIRGGENTLVIFGDVPTDDFTVGNIRYFEGPLREMLDLRPVLVHVRDADSNQPLPARITVTDADGRLAKLYYAESLQTAVRNGVVYTSQGQASFEVPSGIYTIHAVRGMEWSLDRAEVDVDGHADAVDLALRREVDTTGFVACDTHIHTLTHSGHGDSSVEERMVTLAGEGVELAIATDHNHNTDYRPTQVEMGLSRYFTPVVGNEVTTAIGHLNAFPLDPADPVPVHGVRDIELAVAGCRERGAEVVILNHPRWPDHDTGPFGVIGLDHYTGDPLKETWTFPFDALELINSQTEELEPMLLFQDWFALLNRGEHVMAVASSDSHTVGGVVGQGRTYIASSTDDPAAIHVETACRNIVAGKTSISMGIFTDLRHAGQSVMGETLSGAPAGLELTVRSPSWVHPEKVSVFVNGRLTAELPLEPGGNGEGGPTSQALSLYPDGFEAPNDSWIVCVVTGPGVGGSWWPQLNDYTLAATNPVFIDVDSNGWKSPRQLAQELVARTGTEAGAIDAALTEVDQAVAVQALNLVRTAYLREAHQRLLEVGQGTLATHPELEGYLEGLEEPR